MLPYHLAIKKKHYLSGYFY